jgi:thiamine kinase-like enzyme
MEYIIGTKFSDYIHHSPIQNIYNYINIILNFIKSNNTINYIENTNVIQNKIDTVLTDVQETSINKKDFKLLNNVPLSYCHGDLTFENVIINSKGTLYLIDFLDSFINTRLIDYSKILQDLLFMWSWRNDNNKPYAKLVLLQEFLKENLSDSDYDNSYHLMKINLLRILPYVKKDPLLYNQIKNFILK